MDSFPRSGALTMFAHKLLCVHITSVAHLLNVTAKRKNPCFLFVVLLSFSGLQQVLVLGAYLFTLLSVPISLSAPASRHTSHRMSSENGQAKWLNPCGFPSESSHEGDETLTSEQIIRLIVTQANRTYSKASSFKEDFVSNFMLILLSLNTEEKTNELRHKSFD